MEPHEHGEKCFSLDTSVSLDRPDPGFGDRCAQRPSLKCLLSSGRHLLPGVEPTPHVGQRADSEPLRHDLCKSGL